MEQDGLYGVSRRMCDTRQEFEALVESKKLDSWDLSGLRLDNIAAGFKDNDNVMLGYFQLWCEGFGRARFPHRFGAANLYDIEFALQWSEGNRRWIDGEVLHLGCPQTNWRGRSSQRWTA